MASAHSPHFTVFTPTYNRAHTLHRIFDSLMTQTYRDFEWVVVDDGSTDGTRQLIEQWKKVADFSIIYKLQPNSGKHIAFNKGVNLARGDLFLPIDSDDAFLPDALEKMWFWWQQIPQTKQYQFTGIVTLCQYENGEICGDLFESHPLDTNALDLRYKHKKRGESWGFHRTEVLKQYPFPEDKLVRFVPENIVWDAIASKYKIRCINEPLRIFYQDSGNQITKVNPQKKALVKDYFLQMLNRDIRYFFDDPKTFIKWAVLYVRYSFHAADGRFMNVSRFSSVGAYAICLAALLPGFAVFCVDYFRQAIRA
ncbi:MAG: family 2 glycosyl transferase [Proteobacteria bacterium ST_bin12]|nr:MAG: family 2 glycosyl transferase [Proteobacteria bacterium ST_bin12]